MAEELSLHASFPGGPNDEIIPCSQHPGNLSDESLRGPRALPPEHNIPDGNLDVDSLQCSTYSGRGACDCHNAGTY